MMAKEAVIRPAVKMGSFENLICLYTILQMGANCKVRFIVSCHKFDDIELTVNFVPESITFMFSLSLC